MTRLQLYILFEILKTFLLATAIILTLLLVLGGTQQAMRHGLPPSVLVSVLPYLVPEMLVMTAPACVLFSVCSVFGRMASANEITAIKAAGVNPLQLMWPVLVAACWLSMGTFTLYDVAASWARPGLKRTIFDATDQLIYGVLQANGTFSNDELSITVKETRDGELIGPVIQVFEGPHNKRGFTLFAQHANLVKPDDRQILRLSCYKGWVEIGDQATLAFDGRWSHDVHLPAPHLQDPNCDSPAALRLREIPVQAKRMAEHVNRIRTQRDKQPELAEQLSADLVYCQERHYRLQAETSRRLSNGFACLGFALVGIPVAIWRKSADNITVFFTCFAPILLVFYPLLVAGETLARHGVLPGLSVWLADSVLVGLGVLLLRWQTRA